MYTYIHMNHIFCSSCGNKLQYNLAKPNFCTKCGNSLGAASIVKKVLPSQSFSDDDEDDCNEDETSVASVPHIKKLAVEIESYSENASFNLGSLFGQKSENSFKQKRRRSVDDFIDEKKH
jgi:hypothetical protein